MRRLLIFAAVVPASCWLLWASCQSDDYRDTLPLRSFDAAPREAGPPASPPDLTLAVDIGRPDQGPADLPKSDGGVGDAGGSDAGASDAGSSDAGSSDGGKGD
jgi:hypothetical protein